MDTMTKTKIICVCGPENSGKSEAIKSFKDYLEKKQGYKIKNEEGNGSELIELMTLIVGKEDIFEVFNAEKDGRSIKIGIVSEGDFPADWAYIFVLIFIFRCDVVVCAARGGKQSLYRTIVNTVKRLSSRLSLIEVDAVALNKKEGLIVSEIFEKMTAELSQTNN